MFPFFRGSYRSRSHGTEQKGFIASLCRMVSSTTKTLFVKTIVARAHTKKHSLLPEHHAIIYPKPTIENCANLLPVIITMILLIVIFAHVSIGTAEECSRGQIL